MNKRTLLLALLLSACASNPDKISSAYISPMEYSHYDCEQISMEMTNVSRKAQQLYGQLDKEHSADQVQMGVGLVLFWPTLLFLEGGDGPQAAEYAELKGRRDALESAAIAKKCDMAMMPKFVEPKASEPAEKEKKQLNE